MTEQGSPLVFLRDPRLAPLAASETPAWLWSIDASRILWGNPVAAAIFNAPCSIALAGHTIDPKGSAALQIARLAGTLPHGAAPRLERLRGFGGRFGGALLCGCSRIALTDRTPAILVIATEAAGPRLSLQEQAKRLLTGCNEPAALFASDGLLLHATPSAQQRIGRAGNLNELGAAPLASVALAAGHASGDNSAGKISLDRIGNGMSTMLLAEFAEAAAEIAIPIAPQVPPPTMPAVEATAAAEPSTPPPLEQPQPPEQPQAQSPSAPEPPPAAPPPEPAPPASERRPPLRFVWQMDVAGGFTIDSDEFVALIGPKTASALGRPWSEIAARLALDSDGQVARALASHETWSGITVAFPADDTASRFTVELSGLPVFDRDRSFRGYRGFGVCRDIAGIGELKRMRSGTARPGARLEPPVFREGPPPLAVVPPVKNVVPFRSPAPADREPTLTPVERNAFSELANRLAERLRDRKQGPDETASRPPHAAEPPGPVAPPPESDDRPQTQPGARRSSADQRPILDRLPVGVLVYRLDKLIYANRAFLDWTGYEQLHALEEAGGLDALFVESSGSDLGAGNGANNGAKTLTIATNRGDQLPVEARLFTSPWDGESALVLMLTGFGGDDRQKAFDRALDYAKADNVELRAILDAAADGVVVLSHDRTVLSINRSAETLFGYENRELAGLPFATLFGTDGQRVAIEYLDGVQKAGAAGIADGGREVNSRRRDGTLIPLHLTVSRIDHGGDKYCAIFRDLAPWKKSEGELLNAKRRAEVASTAKSEFLAKISHEIRTPLNAIIGFTEVMMQERFGPIGNDRYRQYLKDIRTSGGHLISLLNDLLDLSKIEAGKLELSFSDVDLNALTQECVALMQPQATRERIIIRTSLAADLPQATADPRSVRQILLNLLSNSIKFTGAGGQVIVSTALNDDGDVVLRVRDTGVGMSPQDLAVALEPFRQLATSPRSGTSGSGLGLPLTKALAEANRASFSIRSTLNTGTLVEVAFQRTRLAAE